jgi:hypothetical protein
MAAVVIDRVLFSPSVRIREKEFLEPITYARELPQEKQYCFCFYSMLYFAQTQNPSFRDSKSCLCQGHLLVHEEFVFYFVLIDATQACQQTEPWPSKTQTLNPEL